MSNPQQPYGQQAGHPYSGQQPHGWQQQPWQGGYPAPGYPGQGGYPAPGYPGQGAPRKKTGLIIGIALGAVLLLGGGAAAFFLLGQGGSPQSVANELAAALKSGKAAELAKVTCQPPTKAESSGFDFAMQLNPVAEATVVGTPAENTDNATAIVTLRIKPLSGDAVNAQYRLSGGTSDWCAEVQWSQFAKYAS